MSKLIDLTGHKYGRLTVLERSTDPAHKRVHWRCRCDCGEELVVLAVSLRTGNTKSCGCFNSDSVSARMKTHGHGGTPEYYAWHGMIRRCTQPNHKSYKNYGGRGISVCSRWASSFERFLEDMGPRPSAKHSIDRIDNDGNYEPENCRWADAKTQARNSRKVRRVTVSSEEMTLKEACKRAGLKYGTVASRMSRGQTVEEALELGSQ